MLNSEFLRRQAARCLRIAAAVDDQSVVAALVVMADDFSMKADEIDPNSASSRKAAVRETEKPAATTREAMRPA